MPPWPLRLLAQVEGDLNLIAVLVVAVVGGELGGLLGFKIGTLWGTRLP